MRIKLINPNTTQRMTDAMGRCAREVAAPGTEVIAVNPTMGPPSIEGYYDEALATPGLLAEVAAGEREGCDAYVIACFGDPGLYAAREVARGPVIGIAEAAMHAASVLAPGFSVVTTLARTCGMAWHLAERYGMKRFCRNVRATDVAVLDLDKPGSAARRIILDECRRALAEDGSDAIVLGCAGMAELCREIEDALGAPVIEGVTAAVKWSEALVSLRLSTAKRGDYARPLAKRYDGALESFSPGATELHPQSPRGSAASGPADPNQQQAGAHVVTHGDSSKNLRESAETSDSARVNAKESAQHIHSV
ncbi:allantoin racemase [Paraburkholderia fungorum]|uniref:Hydantoin racemase n=1 Tax=Paraburkholderia fungorum TaxID=134537 RepID=A0A1H1CCZ7_9BURK|nr:aspartate/glutamate racemase family protein [Paraburkholderia fungorum]SDQ62071.1 allantoin racemase [Paraburkholderia fungorum]